MAPSDDEARLEALLRDFGSVLSEAARRMCPHSLGIQAGEIEQEARIRLWQTLRSAKKIERPASYLWKVASTAAIDAVRRVRARREDSLDARIDAGEDSPSDPERSPDRLAARSEARAKLRQGLGRLEESRRLAVELHLQGFTTQEVADLQGWREPKARSLVYRGLEDLRRELEAAGVECEAD
jgi:RNA polymerase sigma-70 factor (ECF subfamily)